MRTFVTADLHLTDKPQDEYRFQFLDWLLKKAQERIVHQVVILGDLTESKDNHSAVLVDRVVNSFNQFSRAGIDIVVMKGNHDYILPGTPFFGFTQHLHKTAFISGPSVVRVGDHYALFLPHTRDWWNTWKKYLSPKGGRLSLAGIDEKIRSKIRFIFLHQVVSGAKAENGAVLKADIPSSFFSWVAKDGIEIFSGDVHVPQKVGDVEYIGAPYPLKFGDIFLPRVMLITQTNPVRYEFMAVPTVQKLALTIGDPESLSKAILARGTQLRVILELSRSEFGSWREYKKKIMEICDSKGWVLHSVELQEKKTRGKQEPTKKKLTGSSRQLLGSFIDSIHLEDNSTIEAGYRFLEEVEKG